MTTVDVGLISPLDRVPRLAPLNTSIMTLLKATLSVRVINSKWDVGDGAEL